MKQGIYTIKDVAQILDGKIVGTPSSEHIHYLITDSRKIIFPESSLFFALKGPQHDGHVFVTKAIQTGVKMFVVSDEKSIQQNTGCFVKYVDVCRDMQMSNVLIEVYGGFL